MREKIIILLCFSLFLFTLNAEENVSKWAEDLAQLRGKIKLLEDKIERENKIYEKEDDELLRAKFLFKSEKETFQNENRELAVLLKSLKEEKSEITEKTSSLYPFLNEKIDFLIKNVQEGIPFKKSERVDKLKKLKNRIELSKTTFYEAATELWRFMEDEIKLSDEIKFSKTVIEEKSGNVLYVDTIRFGMVLMYAENGENYTLYVNTGGETKKFLIDKEAEKTKVALLFSSLKRGVEGGLLSLPLPQKFGGVNE